MQLKVHTVRYVNSSDIYRQLGITEDIEIDQVSYGDADATLIDARDFAAFVEVCVEDESVSQEDILKILPDADSLLVNLEA